jgi:hypothetical protein
MKPGDEYQELVAELVDGKPMWDRCPYDVLTASGHRLEVKGSRLATYGKSVNPKWHFAHLLGTSGRNNYDQLVLVCEGRLPFDPAYFFFDIPHAWVVNYRRLYSNHLNLAYENGKSWIFTELWREFLCEAEVLAQRYGLRRQ